MSLLELLIKLWPVFIGLVTFGFVIGKSFGDNRYVLRREHQSQMEESETKIKLLTDDFNKHKLEINSNIVEIKSDVKHFSEVQKIHNEHILQKLDHMSNAIKNSELNIGMAKTLEKLSELLETKIK